MMRQQRRVEAGHTAARQRQYQQPQEIIVSDWCCIKAHGDDDTDKGRPQSQYVLVCGGDTLAARVQIVRHAIQDQGIPGLRNIGVVGGACISKCVDALRQIQGYCAVEIRPGVGTDALIHLIYHS